MSGLHEIDLFGEEIKPQASSVVAQRFGFPPFTVLDAKTGEWQDRKRAWTALGIKSEVGRGAALISSKDNEDYRLRTGKYSPGFTELPEEQKHLLLAKSSGTDFYAQKRKIERELGRELSTAEFQEKFYEEKAIDNGTSVFDPVLCELAYRWFSPPGGQVVDPFAGGSVRGIVAGAMGRKYWGCDLRQEQIEANIAQGKSIDTKETPKWVCGDSLVKLDEAPSADFLFSCPPYGDLEVYSNDPSDLSAMEWPKFLEAYDAIIAKGVAKLKQNRFACFVVGDFRDDAGHYRNFIAKTTAAFEKAGCHFYNDAVLLTMVGSASMRVSRQFMAGRKFAKTHQNILVYIKGDGKKAADACGPCEEGF